MTVTILYDSLRNRSVLVENDRAFGPVFRGDDAGFFLDWIVDQPDAPKLTDVSDTTIEIWVEHWRRYAFEVTHPWPRRYEGRAA